MNNMSGNPLFQAILGFMRCSDPLEGTPRVSSMSLSPTPPCGVRHLCEGSRHAGCMRFDAVADIEIGACSSRQECRKDAGETTGGHTQETRAHGHTHTHHHTSLHGPRCGPLMTTPEDWADPGSFPSVHGGLFVIMSSVEESRVNSQNRRSSKHSPVRCHEANSE